MKSSVAKHHGCRRARHYGLIAVWDGLYQSTFVLGTRQDFHLFALTSTGDASCRLSSLTAFHWYSSPQSPVQPLGSRSRETVGSRAAAQKAIITVVPRSTFTWQHGWPAPYTALLYQGSLKTWPSGTARSWPGCRQCKQYRTPFYVTFTPRFLWNLLTMFCFQISIIFVP